MKVDVNIKEGNIEYLYWKDIKFIFIYNNGIFL